jgi:hypothetical protein
MTYQNIPWQKYIPTMSAITHMSSLPCGFATWTSNNNAFVQFNVNIEIHQGWCPMRWNKKKVFGAFIKNLAPWFQTCFMWQNIIYQQKGILHCHVICGRCHPSRCNGRQVKHSCNMNLSTKHMWSNIIIIHTIQKSSNKRYFDRFNNIIVENIFLKCIKNLMHSL